MTLTATRHTVLMKLADGQPRLGREVGNAFALKALSEAGYIKASCEAAGYSNDLWTITPSGSALIGVEL